MNTVLTIPYYYDNYTLTKVRLQNSTSSIASYLRERFVTILKEPVLKAACIFEHARWPGASSPQLNGHGDDEIKLLLKHYEKLYSYLGGDPSKALREWSRLKRFVTSPDNPYMTARRSLMGNELLRILMAVCSHLVRIGRSPQRSQWMKF